MQAYPAADDAKPAAVGKLFSEHMWTFIRTPSPEFWQDCELRCRTVQQSTLKYYAMSEFKGAS